MFQKACGLPLLQYVLASMLSNHPYPDLSQFLGRKLLDCDMLNPDTGLLKAWVHSVSSFFEFRKFFYSALNQTWPKSDVTV